MGKLSIHHIVPKSRGGFTGIDINIVRLEINVHAYLHCIFGNASPTQQIKEILFFDSPKNNKFYEISFLLSTIHKNKIHNIIYEENIIFDEKLLYKEVLHKSNNSRKILVAYNDLFGYNKHTEDKINKMLEINKVSLNSNFIKKIKNILN